MADVTIINGALWLCLTKYAIVHAALNSMIDEYELYTNKRLINKLWYVHVEKNCKNNVNNFTIVHDIITQPVPNDCPRKCTFCSINSVL